MMTGARAEPTLSTLDAPTRELVRLAAVISAGDEGQIRDALTSAAAGVPRIWIEELILQTYLFSGFPRALNAMREWRRIAGAPTKAPNEPAIEADGEHRARGEATCEQVYGSMYERLRVNIRALHPTLDRWMIAEGYGKVLSRPGLDLPRRELCIIAACAASAQGRQLHSHLHGAVNVGVRPRVVSDAIDALEPVLAPQLVASTRLLWERVRGKQREAR